MVDRKKELPAEIAATIARLAELALEAKALGLSENDLEAIVGPVLEKFEGVFNGD